MSAVSVWSSVVVPVVAGTTRFVGGPSSVMRVNAPSRNSSSAVPKRSVALDAALGSRPSTLMSSTSMPRVLAYVGSPVATAVPSRERDELNRLVVGLAASVSARFSSVADSPVSCRSPS